MATKREAETQQEPIQQMAQIAASAVHVFQAMNAVAAEMSQEGIEKARSNTQQGFKFRGIDDVLNSLSSKFAKHKLLMLPRVVDRSVIDRQTAKGGTLIYTTLDVEFDFVSAVDGSTVTIRTVGEAMDSGDKSANKAMSAAYKYAAIQAFAIPTEGMLDADQETHQVAPQATVMPVEELSEHVELMRKAPALADLKTTYEVAIKAAQALGDTSAEAVFQITKNGRKRQLENAAQPEVANPRRGAPLPSDGDQS